MEEKKVRDLMIPEKEFPAISSDANFAEALTALEKAQEEYASGKTKQRILLVKDEKGFVIGKLSPIDLSRGLEPGYKDLDERLKNFTRFGVGYLVKPLKEQYWLWSKPFSELCRKALNEKVKDFMRRPDENHVIAPGDYLSEALHLFVTGSHDSLFVTENGSVVGLLRFSDIYRMISNSVKHCTKG